MKDTRTAVIDSHHFTDEALMPFARMLAEGKTVAFPTETVYGLGADATNPQALKAIFTAKGRPADNPLIVHVSEAAHIQELVQSVTPLAATLIRHFWPGPLTIILKKSPKVSDLITAGLDTVALRMPAHPLARRLIALAGVPVAAPSANRSGRPSPTRGTHVMTDLMGRVDAIIDGGPCDVGLESTVVDATGTEPVILRPGGITREMLAAVTGKVSLDPGLFKQSSQQNTVPRSPGMKYTHYAPKAQVVVAATPEDPEAAAVMLLSLWQQHREKTPAIGILCTDEAAYWLNTRLQAMNQQQRPLIKNLGSIRHPEIMAASLFLRFREFDETPVALILAQRVADTAIGFALMNRLLKAAGYRQE